jgi:aryl-alcohol dehydrogenase-like predicted oxidoreductase
MPVPAPAEPMPTLKGVPKRKLGRTGIEVPPLGMGLAPMGHALFPPDEFEPVVHAAIDAGIAYLDVAPNYDVAEQRVGPVMAKRRNEVFLAGKVEPRAWRKDETVRLIETSLKKVQSDHLDLCHIHNIHDFTEVQAIGKGGCLDGIKEARKRGLVRFIGVSGHLGVGRFVPVLETGEIDVLMCPLNFVDRFTYNWEERVLPIARKYNTAIVAMKVLGGSMSFRYSEKAPALLASPEHYQAAIRYSMGLADVATCVVGLKSLGELRMAINAARGFKPFSAEEQAWVDQEGKWLAGKWKAHMGPVG